MTTLWITLILLGIAVLYFGLKLLIIWLLWDAAVSKADVLMRALKNLDSHEFACPNCGSHFKRKWWLYAFSPFSHRAIAALTFGKTNFKCPHCGKYDTCIVVENQK